MIQLSNELFCPERVLNLNFPVERILPNPYSKYPFLVIDNFLSKSNIKYIYKKIKEIDEFEIAKVKVIKNSALLAKVDKSVRKTNLHELPIQCERIYNKAFNRFKNKIEEFFNLILLENSGIQTLGYGEGGYYVRHVDNCSELVDKDGNLIGWKAVAPMRKVTTVLFLNSSRDKTKESNDFSGGELVFNLLFDKEDKLFSFKPKAGTLIAFPSNPIFTHEVKEVTKGYRITLVQWHNALVN